jgi:ADP-heptose:LPS heptosyltransferase
MDGLCTGTVFKKRASIRVKTLLYFGPSGIGDWCFIWPSLPSLLEQHGCDRVHIVVPYRNKGNELLALNSLVSEVTYLDRCVSGVSLGSYAFRWMKLLLRLRRCRFTVLAVSYLSNQVDFLLLAALSGIPVRIGRDFPGAPFLGSAFNRRVHCDSSIGRVKVHASYLDHWDGNTKVAMFDEALAQKQGLMNAELPDRFVVLASGGGREAGWRFWPPLHYQTLVRCNPDINFVLLGGGQDDLDQASAISGKHGFQNLYDLVNKTTMVQGLTLISRAMAVVGNDTGIPNIAATLGVPTLVIYGPSNYEITGAHILGSEEVHIQVPCSPCFDDRQDPAKAEHCPHRNCMQMLDPERVAIRMRNLIKSSVAGLVE